MKFCLIFALLTFALTACGNQEIASTPTATIKNYYEAARKGDTAAVKNTLSKGTLKMHEEAARAHNISPDEAIKTSTAQAANVPAPETRNEQINGDTATIEIKNPVTGTWDKLPLVREEKNWKIAHDKYMNDLLKDTEALQSK